MTTAILLIGSGIAVLSLVLGFVALLSQRIYLDPETQKPTDIQLPILGKMKTNYPALVFVMLSFALTFYLLHKVCPARPVDWEITGQLACEEKGIDWSTTHVRLFPTEVEHNIHPYSGVFRIECKIEEGRSFEGAVEQIIFTHKKGSFILDPKDQLEKYQKGEESLIKRITPRSRIYGVLQLEVMPEGEKPKESGDENPPGNR